MIELLLALTMLCKHAPQVVVSDVYTQYMGLCSQFKVDSTAAINKRPRVSYCAVNYSYRDLSIPLKLTLDNNNHAIIKARLAVGYQIEVHCVRTGKSIKCDLADAGPAGWTGKDIDLSSSAMKSLGAETGDVVIFTLVTRGRYFE